jgi:RNA polymerase sigma factor (sigma-70 family)
MEAARTLRAPLAERRLRRFTRECEALRPLGVVFVLRRFGNTLDHADAEDAVSDVIIRLHRKSLAGQPPDNLRAAFFTSVRNAAIDLLRSRSARPTVPLEAVVEAPAALPSPEEAAEAGDDLHRLREALARMRPNYREAIVLRFGLGLTVPEIAARLQISLPAAKKLVLRSTNQIRERMQSISGAEFCPQMRELAERSLFDREAAGVAEEADSAAIKAHFEHCGPCRSFLAALHHNLNELGSSALLGGYAAHSGALHQLGSWADRLLAGSRAISTKARLAAYKASTATAPGDAGAPGAFAASAQKVAALCTAGAATTATCLATGIIGPGLGVGVGQTTPQHHIAPAAMRASAHQDAGAQALPLPPPPMASAPASTPALTPEAKVSHRSESRSASADGAQTPSQQAAEEFGFESQSESSSATASTPSGASASSVQTPSPPASTPSGSSPGAGSARGTEGFGFSG